MKSCIVRQSEFGEVIWRALWANKLGEGMRWVKQILSQIFVPFLLFCHPNLSWLVFLPPERKLMPHIPKLLEALQGEFAWRLLLAGCINCPRCTKLDNILSRFQNLCCFICCFVIFDFVAISFNTALWYFEGIKIGHSGKCVCFIHWIKQKHYFLFQVKIAFLNRKHCLLQHFSLWE